MNILKCQFSPQRDFIIVVAVANYCLQLLPVYLSFVPGLCSLSPFPPKILLHLWAHGRHQVVEVHHHVDPHVQEPTEGCVAPANKPNTIFFCNFTFELYILKTYFMPHQAVKGMIPWCTTCRVER